MRALAVALAFALAPLPLAAQNGVRPTEASLERPAPKRATARAERTTVCRGAMIPVGWILVDNMKEPTMCNGQDAQALALYNVWAIEHFANRPVGATIDVCASTPTPEGWEMVDVFRDREKCGHPSDVFQPNVKRIRRGR